MFESRGAKEKLPTRASGKPDAETISSWSYDMEGLFYDKRNESDEVNLTHAMTWKVTQRNVERYCELAKKTTQHFFKVATPCMDDHQFEENESVGELSAVCSQIVLK